MNYIEVSVKTANNTNENRDILCAMLGEINFESFTETEFGINAYIKKENFPEAELKNLLNSLDPLLGNYETKITEIQQQNWNKEWEKNFEPIIIDQKCLIRAPFHDKSKTFNYEIVIEPKMSFGTGHHATTSSMVSLILELNCTDKTILDMGCGTGVLGILAAQKQAKHIDAIDIDNWAYQNSIENAERNKISNFYAYQGDASLLKNKKYDIIFANINRNILLADMHRYNESLKNNALLLLSGFYTDDLPIINKKANELGLKLQKQKENSTWIAAQFIKSN